MPSMGVLVLIATIVLCLAALAWSFLRHRRGHGPRVLVRGLGVVVAIVGLYLSGLSALAANGARSIYHWAQRTTLTRQMEVGLGLVALGILLLLIGTILRPRTREEARAVRERRRGAVADTGQAAPAVRPSGRSAARPAARPVEADEDDEVAAILRSRGIE